MRYTAHWYDDHVLTTVRWESSLDDELRVYRASKNKEGVRAIRAETEARKLREEDSREVMFENYVDAIIYRIEETAQTKQIDSSIPKRIEKACYNALKGMDQAFIAGILRSSGGKERDDSKNFSKNKSYKMKRKAVTKAKAYFELANGWIKIIEEEEYENLELLLASDEDTLSLTRVLFTYIKAVSANTIKNEKTALQNSESLVTKGKKVRCDMQKDVRNAEANNDFMEKLMWIKSIAKRESWSARILARNLSSLSKAISMSYKTEKDKEDDENGDTDTEEVKAEGDDTDTKKNDSNDTEEKEVKAEGDDTDTKESNDTDAEEEKVEAEEVRDAEAIHDVSYICSLMLILCGISTCDTYDITRRVWTKTIAHAQKPQEYNDEDDLKINMPKATLVDIDISDPSSALVSQFLLRSK